MAYQWPQDPEDLFVERYQQMTRLGLAVEDVDAVRAAVTEMWPDAPGGWVYEWSQLAARYADQDRPDLAVLAYGWAKFPCLADEHKRVAMVRQLEQYELAAPSFEVTLERRILDVPHRGGTTPVPVHILAPPDLPAEAPVVLASGGVDTWKVDLHAIFSLCAQFARARVLAFDIAGTGESVVPMTADGGAEIVEGLIAEARRLGNGRVGHLGASMGGHFSARSGLSGLVDAAVVWGGPVGATPLPSDGEPVDLPFGMSHIVANAFGFDEPPSPGQWRERMAAFSLRDLLDQDRNSPMLVVNGADDVYIPRQDVLVFEGRRDTTAVLIPDAGHCAVTKIAEIVPMMLDWLAKTLHT